MSQDNPLEPIRRQITEVDQSLLDLLAKRRALSLDVARTKADNPKPVRDSERESALLTRLVTEGRQRGLDGQYISRLFHAIIEDSVLRQQAWFQAQVNPGSQGSTTVAYLGARGSYSHLAVHNYFGRRDRTVNEMGLATFDAIFDAVEKGQAEYGILPIENTSSGAINEVFDLLQHTSLHIVGETTETIAHCLLVQPGTKLDSINTIYAHPQVHTQCSRFLATLSGIKQEYCASSAEAMEKVSQDPSGQSAAIGHQQGGACYGLQVLDTELANQQQNESRFIVVARKPQDVPAQVPAKTTLLMATAQKPGALVEALLVLRDHGINMTKLESRPIHGNPWEEMFYLDVEANVASDTMRRALAQLTRLTRFIKVLGCYPCETILPTELDSGAMANDPRLAATTNTGLAHNAPLHSRSHKAENSQVRVKGLSLGEQFVTLVAAHGSDPEQLAHLAKEHGGSAIAIEADASGKVPQITTSLPRIVTVTDPAQLVDLAADADLIWLPAEQMHYPALHEAVGRSQRPVLLTRAPDASNETWLGAAERILGHGNQQVILCEQGQTDERGSRHLDLAALASLQQQTHLPLVVDPSLAVADAGLQTQLARAIRAMGAQGLMLHLTGQEAPADSGQLSDTQYGQLMKNLYC